MESATRLATVLGDHYRFERELGAGAHGDGVPRP